MVFIRSITPLIILLMASASIALSTETLDSAIISGVVAPGQRVDTSLRPQWAGVMHPDDCAKARALFGGRVAFHNPHWLMVFWSRRWTVQPKGGHAFELPFGVRYSAYSIYLLPPPSTIQVEGNNQFRWLIRLFLVLCIRILHSSRPHGQRLRRRRHLLRRHSSPLCSNACPVVRKLVPHLGNDRLVARRCPIA